MLMKLFIVIEVMLDRRLFFFYKRFFIKCFLFKFYFIVKNIISRRFEDFVGCIEILWIVIIFLDKERKYK